MLKIVYKKITIRGFLVKDFMNFFLDLLLTTVNHLRTSTLHTVEEISTCLESIPQVFIGLFHSSNVGKKIVKLII
ncbi:Alcohol dehydrogenase superfamily, zinc-type [Parasponia andersonii]|uniref:Alcohol dehydrogenase superfamily, zinc-type n=1 Tax=Parasponia andersonii TaxID=3476 RepID=A0A2P5AS08_PARAD|nr:Alcohol dehydrogenase superfamily, zinc-type [Parasponia andersonii]